MGTYRHRPLESREHIRIFRLDQGAFHEPLRCRIEHILAPQNKSSQTEKDLKRKRGAGNNLNALPGNKDSSNRTVKYEAISYVWGDASDRELIDCMEGSVLVPRNLIAALWQLREKNRGMVFWADSICINQDDDAEKSTQVARMGSIFSNAERVIMWLGEEDDDTASCLESLGQLCDLFRSGKDSEQFQRFTKLYHWCGEKRMTALPDPTVQKLKNPNWRSLAALICRPYFTRLWVIQEVALAREAIAMCGSQELNWTRTSGMGERPRELFSELHTVLKFASGKDHEMLRGMHCWLNMKTIERMVSDKPNSFRFYMFVGATGQFQCSDPRDYIYGSLNIVSDFDLLHDEELRPDYTLTTENVFLRAAVWMLVKKQMIYPLETAAAEAYRIQSYPRWPSWVLNYIGTYRTHDSLLDYSETRYQKGPNAAFARAGGSKNELAQRGYEQKIALSNDDRELLVFGKIVTEIKHISILDTRENDYYTDFLGVNFFVGLSTDEGNDILAAVFLKSSLSEIFPNDWRLHLYSTDFQLLLSFLADTNERTADLLNDEITKRAMKTIEFLEKFYFLEARPNKTALEERKVLPLQGMSAEIVNVGKSHSFCRTVNGRLGMVPVRASPGDVIAVIYRTQLPFVLRPVSEGKYRVVGHCFLGDVTFGAALENDDLPTQRITLV